MFDNCNTVSIEFLPDYPWKKLSYFELYFDMFEKEIVLSNTTRGKLAESYF